MSSKTKKVHYERGTKEGSHRSSRDSGFGSASDRASLGIGVDDSTSSYQQRHDIDAFQDALDAAYETIKQLESTNQILSSSLAESNKENRQLRKEKASLLDKMELLLLDVGEERKVTERPKWEASTRSTTQTSPLQVEPPRPSSGRRASLVHDLPPVVLQPQPNPFAPLHTRLPPPVTYPQSPTLLYAPATNSYTPGPTYAPTSTSSSRGHYATSTTSSKPKDDGRYHLTPL